VNFWGAQWAKKNQLSGGAAPSSFKGFTKTVAAPVCGGAWNTGTGNASNPPATVPQYMAVVVASSASQAGPVVSGNVAEIVVVYTGPGYGLNPGHEGNGTVLYTLCP
jgi:hypothetical protein